MNKELLRLHAALIAHTRWQRDGYGQRLPMLGLDLTIADSWYRRSAMDVIRVWRTNRIGDGLIVLGAYWQPDTKIINNGDRHVFTNRRY